MRVREKDKGKEKRKGGQRAYDELLVEGVTRARSENADGAQGGVAMLPLGTLEALLRQRKDGLHCLGTTDSA